MCAKQPGYMTNSKHQNRNECILFVASNNDLYLPIYTVMATITFVRLLSKRSFQNVQNRIGYMKSNNIVWNLIWLIFFFFFLKIDTFRLSKRNSSKLSVVHVVHVSMKKIYIIFQGQNVNVPIMYNRNPYYNIDTLLWKISGTRYDLDFINCEWISF